MNRSINDADALRDEIAYTRAELGETVQALAARADVPARARASARRGATSMRLASSRPGVWLVIGAGAAAVATLVAMSRIRRSRRSWGGFGRRGMRGWR